MINRWTLFAVGFFLGLTRMAAAEDTAARTLRIPAEQAWTETQIDVTGNVPLRVSATGTAFMVGSRVWEWMTGSSVAAVTTTYAPSCVVSRMTASGPSAAFTWRSASRLVLP